MKAPLEWLQEYVDIDIPLDELTDRMIMHGLGIEGVERIYEAYDKVVVGRLDNIEKHPNADRLQICTVGLGDRQVQIITAADNVYEGMVCPIAQDDTLLPNGKHIKAGEMRGEKSDGMLCSGEELCIDESEFKGASVDGILDMGSAYADKLGEPFFTASGLDNYVIDFEIGANRGDCLNMIGIAREVSAALGKPFREPKISYQPAGGKAAEHVKIDVRDKDLCSRYTARVITDIQMGDSPLWMQRRLQAAGVRPISNIVDITNYVMLEYGQPLHAFDFDDVKNGEVVVRRAYEDETIVTLDGKERELSTDMLMITDPVRSIGLAGVMGGQNSEITENTKMALLESAHFNGGNNRRTSRALGLMSEAAMRYSKGISPLLSELGSLRAAQLITELGCGNVMEGVVDTNPNYPAHKTIEVYPGQMNELLGTDIPVEVMVDCLGRVFIEATLTGETMVCKVPSQRSDIEIQEDIAEEIARVYGYEDIPIYPLGGMASGGYSPRQKLRERARRHMMRLGLHESMTMAFASKRAFDDANFAETDGRRDCPRILNPLSEDYAQMRTTLVPAMMQVLALNAHNRNADCQLFEISNVHVPEKDADGLPTQLSRMAIGIGGEKFLTLKGMLESLYGAFGLTLKLEADGPEYYHPGRKATLWLNGEKAGEMGELHPETLEKLDIDGRACIAEIDMDLLIDNADTSMVYTPLPRYPALERDMALSVNRDVQVGPMMEIIRQVGGDVLESCDLFDVYEGEQAGEGKKSVAFSLRFRAADRTLKDEEANVLFDKMCASLEQKYGAKLRGA